jgi:hypothetical protein
LFAGGPNNGGQGRWLIVCCLASAAALSVTGGILKSSYKNVDDREKLRKKIL